MVHSDVGCSRTLPVASSWNGQDAGANNSGGGLTVKREPLASVPCQVAEVSTSLHATTTSVKIEPVPPKSENGKCLSESIIHSNHRSSNCHRAEYRVYRVSLSLAPMFDSLCVRREHYTTDRIIRGRCAMKIIHRRYISRHIAESSRR